MFKEAQENRYIEGNLPDDPAELKELAREILKNMEYAEVQFGSGTGTRGDAVYSKLDSRRQPSV